MRSYAVVFVALAVASITTTCDAFTPSNKPLHPSLSLESTIVATPLINDFSDATNFANVEDYPKAGAIMKMLPADTWKVSTKTSMLYFGIDVLAVAVSMGFLNAVVNSDIYHHMALWQQFLSVVPLQVLTGFAMWCTWCIGHDAGHGTVSKNKQYGQVVNRVVGEIAHSVICLTPFVPWALSHKKHHLHHNHLDRDYSHQWFVREEYDNLHPALQFFHSIRMLYFPFLYFVYLFTGIPDGGHVFFYGRMWEGESLRTKLDGAVSSVISLVTAATLWHTMGLANFCVVCMMPWSIMGFWLFMVTYLQHHSEQGKLYTDETFSFEKGAFETVDRNYGKWINRMSHHMMDGHVIHHLFFTKVPHYRLEAATLALQKGMKKRGQEHLYKQIDTPDFTQEILRQFNDNWFFINEEQVVRK
jgi:omega-3 fatty acid desaturase (delta-15 desaturase)